METFGQKMRQAVADRGLRLDQLMKETGLPIEHLQALTCDDFGALPDDDIVENGLRSFARMVGVDPEQVVQDYRSERQAWLDSVETVKAAVPEPTEEAPAAHPGRFPAIATWTVAVLSLSVLVFFWLRSPATGSARPAVPVPEAAPATTAGTESPEPGAPESSPPVEPVPAKSFPVDEPPVRPSVVEPLDETSGLWIPQHDVGRDVVDHQLVGATDRFTLGERAWFWTRVENGAGETIDHVWFHEGTEVLRVPLRVGGKRWRTQSYKTLTRGSEGRWVIEAQDESGRVLARRDFICAPTR